ncbi:MAG: hypothetical protein ACRDTJ_02625 [Pseudonocardiaceae bacterium]
MLIRPRPVVRLLTVAELPPAGDPRWADLLSPAELAFCTSLARVTDHLAARAAGKQAVRAVLGLPPQTWPERYLAGAGAPRGHDVEIHRVSGSAPQVVLSGDAQRWRRALGLPPPGVSLSHAAGYAAALAWLLAP